MLHRSGVPFEKSGQVAAQRVTLSDAVRFARGSRSAARRGPPPPGSEAGVAPNPIISSSR
ncbi:hypothetical protein PAHAL_5G495500 [Panicum hallii]|uniref:Uncharacterized protein n=1 Tax=Panicum hallii TaxID=206008 RepID=A0A2T8IP16_9POAL|nr:hypothetical protein PAHAL_5G495500 [Panicum hallii]